MDIVDIGEYWGQEGSPRDQGRLIEILLAAGLTDAPADRRAAVQFLRDEHLDPSIAYNAIRLYQTRQAERKLERDAAALKRGIESLHAITEEAMRRATTLEALRAFVDQLAAQTDTIRAIYAPPREPLAPDELLEFDHAKTIPIDFLGGLTLPSPGITFIGGKTGGGKTTALVNAARSCLQAGLTTAVFSYEQSAQELALLLALSLTAAINTEPLEHQPIYGSPRRWIPKFVLPAERNDPLQDWPTALKAHIMAHRTEPDFLAPAYDLIRQYIYTGQLEIWDYYGNAEELADRIRRTAFDIYLIDYIQVVPPSPGGRRDGYQRIADVAGAFRRLASTDSKTLLIGAQFNRQNGETADPAEYDPSLEQFREAGDIEHLATMALGLGWYKTANGTVHYWKVLKHRYNGAARGMRLFSGGDPSNRFDFHYIQPYSRWYRPTEWPPAEPQKITNRIRKGDIL